MAPCGLCLSKNTTQTVKARGASASAGSRQRHSWSSPDGRVQVGAMTELGNQVCCTPCCSGADFFPVEVENIVKLCIKDCSCPLHGDLPPCHCLSHPCSSQQHSGVWRLSFFMRLKQPCHSNSSVGLLVACGCMCVAYTCGFLNYS